MSSQSITTVRICAAQILTVVMDWLDIIGLEIFLLFLDDIGCTIAWTCYIERMDIDPYYDNTDDQYDNTIEEMTDEEAIEELMAEGYSEAEARRMIGEYDADDDYTEHDDDIPDFDPNDFVDEEDFD